MSRYIVGYYRDTVDFDPGAGVHTVNSATDGSDFILKLDSTGNFTWVHTLGVLPAAFSSVAIALDSSDNIYSTGTIYGTVDMDPGVGVSYFTSAGVHDMQVSKFDSSGAFLWGATAGGTDLDMATDIAVDQSGSPVITGSSYSPALIFGADTLWNTGTLEVMPVAKLHPVPVGITQRTPPIQTQVYPNPSNEKVTIVCRDMEQVDIYDALGNLVVSHPLHSNAQNETAIDVSGLKSGIYYLKIVSREGEVVSRLVKISE